MSRRKVMKELCIRNYVCREMDEYSQRYGDSPDDRLLGRKCGKHIKTERSSIFKLNSPIKNSLLLFLSLLFFGLIERSVI